MPDEPQPRDDRPEDSELQESATPRDESPEIQRASNNEEPKPRTDEKPHIEIRERIPRPPSRADAAQSGDSGRHQNPYRRRR